MTDQERRQRIYDRLYDAYQYSPKAQKELEDAGPDGIQLREQQPFPARRVLLAATGVAGVIAMLAWVVR